MPESATEEGGSSVTPPREVEGTLEAVFFEEGDEGRQARGHEADHEHGGDEASGEPTGGLGEAMAGGVTIEEDEGEEVGGEDDVNDAGKGPEHVELSESKGEPPAPKAGLGGASEGAEEDGHEHDDEAVTAGVAAEADEPGVPGIAEGHPGDAVADAPDAAAPDESEDGGEAGQEGGQAHEGF